jgi:N-acyl-D-amino-acid deacylase
MIFSRSWQNGAHLFVSANHRSRVASVACRFPTLNDSLQRSRETAKESVGRSIGRFNWIFRIVFLAIAGLAARGADFDVIIRGGRIIDGTGNPAYFADIGVRHGRIAAIGKIAATAPEEINATEKIVCPGFIDVHTHAEDIIELPLAENFIRMGVTTLVLGNCGSSVRDVGEFFHRVEANKTSANIATLIGHGTIRSSVMGGSFMRPPTRDEMEKMEALVDDAMQDGAVGLSTGLIYLPGIFAKTDELIALAKVAGRHDGIYASHMRDEGLAIFDALNELFKIAREAKIRAHVSHIKLSRPAAWNQTDRVLGAIEASRLDGLDITQDQYVYTASSTGISQLIPEEAREGGREKFIERLNTPEIKAGIADKMKLKLKDAGFKDFSYAVIASYQKNTSLNGMNIVQAAKRSSGSDSLDEQIALILDIEKNGGASGVFHGINEDDLQSFARHPNTMFASDSGIRRFGDGVPHPRGYGNNARVLARYVRELKCLRLEDAIRRMTSLPAVTFRLKHRGQLIEGNWADIVVLDPTNVQDNSTFNSPHHYATGFQHVLVNGVTVSANGQHIGTKPGQPIRRGAD